MADIFLPNVSLPRLLWHRHKQAQYIFQFSPESTFEQIETVRVEAAAIFEAYGRYMDYWKF
ncbi:MAG: hypothetical protein RSC25_03650 [Christensenella sp.]